MSLPILALTETEISKAMASAVSTKALIVPYQECRYWIFGGCAFDREVWTYLQAHAIALGFDPTNKEYDRDGLVSYLTKLIGSRMANAAADIIEEGM